MKNKILNIVFLILFLSSNISPRYFTTHITNNNNALRPTTTSQSPADLKTDIIFHPNTSIVKNRPNLTGAVIGKLYDSQDVTLRKMIMSDIIGCEQVDPDSQELWLVFYYFDRSSDEIIKLFDKDGNQAKVKIQKKADSKNIGTLEDDSPIKGFGSRSSRYLAQGILQDKAARYDVSAKALYSMSEAAVKVQGFPELPTVELPTGPHKININTFTRGCGKQIRGIASLDAVFRYGNNFSAPQLLNVIIEKFLKGEVPIADFNINDIALITYNGLRGKYGIELTYGLKDIDKRVGPAANNNLSSVLSGQGMPSAAFSFQESVNNFYSTSGPKSGIAALVNNIRKILIESNLLPVEAKAGDGSTNIPIELHRPEDFPSLQPEQTGGRLSGLLKRKPTEITTSADQVEHTGIFIFVEKTKIRILVGDLGKINQYYKDSQSDTNLLSGLILDLSIIFDNESTAVIAPKPSVRESDSAKRLEIQKKILQAIMQSLQRSGFSGALLSTHIRKLSDLEWFLSLSEQTTEVKWNFFNNLFKKTNWIIALREADIINDEEMQEILWLCNEPDSLIKESVQLGFSKHAHDNFWSFVGFAAKQRGTKEIDAFIAECMLGVRRFQLMQRFEAIINEAMQRENFTGTYVHFILEKLRQVQKPTEHFTQRRRQIEVMRNATGEDTGATNKRDGRVILKSRHTDEIAKTEKGIHSIQTAQQDIDSAGHKHIKAIEEATGKSEPLNKDTANFLEQLVREHYIQTHIAPLKEKTQRGEMSEEIYAQKLKKAQQYFSYDEYTKVFLMIKSGKLPEKNEIYREFLQWINTWIDEEKHKLAQQRKDLTDRLQHIKYEAHKDNAMRVLLEHYSDKVRHLTSYQTTNADVLMQEALEHAGAMDVSAKIPFNSAQSALSIIPAAASVSAKTDTAATERGYSGLPNVVYKNPIMTAFDSGNVSVLAVKDGLFVPSFVLHEQGNRPLDGVIDADLISYFSRNFRTLSFLTEYDLKILENNDMKIVFVDSLDERVREQALELGISAESLKSVFGAHYGITRNQIYLDSSLIQDTSQISMLALQLHHEIQEREHVLKELEKQYGFNWRDLRKRADYFNEINAFISRQAYKKHIQLKKQEAFILLANGLNHNVINSLFAASTALDFVLNVGSVAQYDIDLMMEAKKELHKMINSWDELFNNASISVNSMIFLQMRHQSFSYDLAVDEETRKALLEFKPVIDSAILQELMLFDCELSEIISSLMKLGEGEALGYSLKKRIERTLSDDGGIQRISKMIKNMQLFSRFADLINSEDLQSILRGMPYVCVKFGLAPSRAARIRFNVIDPSAQNLMKERINDLNVLIAA